MNTRGAGRDCEGTERRSRSTDFLFIGSGVAPLALMLGGQPGLGFLVLVPLLLAACLCGAWEQAKSGPEHSASDGNYRGRFGRKRPIAVAAFRDRLKR